MLDFLRKRKRSWVIVFIIGIMSFGLSLYFGTGSLIEDPSLGTVASINGEAISSSELDRLVTRALRANRNNQQINEVSLRLSLLQDMIQTRLLLQEARRLGLTVTDKELSTAIAETPIFQTNGKFDKNLYLRLLRLNRVIPSEYEEDRKNDLLINKLLDIVRDSVHVNEADIKEQYELEMAKVNLNFIRLRRNNFVQNATASAEETKTYYDQNQEELKEPLKVSVEYVAYPHTHFSDKVKVSDKEIEDYYKENRDTKFHQPYAVRLRHIYFRIPEPKGPKQKEKIRAKAERILAQAREGKDFAQLAKDHSDDFSSTSGGDTGFLTSKDILPELQDTAFGLKKDEISGVLESTNGLHILKGVETRKEKTKTLDEAKQEIIQTIKTDRGTQQAVQAAQTDRGLVLEGKTLATVAKERGFSPKVTPFFREEEGLKDVGPEDAFYTTSFALTPSELSPVVEGKKAAYLIKL
ncbi:MAG: hypothetical protein GTO40_17535, partial [Deltaproteobacteria bacterium]|nr:hypothetical protein [Deltaproteobacteria bacterium]